MVKPMARQALLQLDRTLAQLEASTAKFSFDSVECQVDFLQAAIRKIPKN